MESRFSWLGLIVACVMTMLVTVVGTSMITHALCKRVNRIEAEYEKRPAWCKPGAIVVHRFDPSQPPKIILNPAPHGYDKREMPVYVMELGERNGRPSYERFALSLHLLKPAEVDDKPVKVHVDLSKLPPEIRRLPKLRIEDENPDDEPRHNKPPC